MGPGEPNSSKIRARWFGVWNVTGASGNGSGGGDVVAVVVVVEAVETLLRRFDGPARLNVGHCSSSNKLSGMTEPHHCFDEID